MIEFANIKYLPYILVVTILVLLFFIAYLFWKRSSIAQLIPNATLRQKILSTYGVLPAIKNALLIAAIFLFAFTILRPRWGEELRESSIEGVDLLVALDVSTSMNARDVAPSRLDRAKDAIRILASSLHGDRIGLVLFAGEAFLQCPLTADIEAFTMFLNSASSASVRLQGTDIGAAIDMAYRVFNRRRMTARNFVIITDGEDHEGKVTGAIEKFKDLGVTVYVIGVGYEGGEVIPLAADDPSGDVYQRDSRGNVVRTKLNQQLLRSIADATGGLYFDINNSFSGIYRIIDRMKSQVHTRDGVHLVKQKKDRYYIFALLLVILLLVELLIPEKKASAQHKKFTFPFKKIITAQLVERKNEFYKMIKARIVKLIILLLSCTNIFWIDPYRDAVEEGNKKYFEKKFDQARKHYDDAANYAPGEREKKKLRFNHGNARYMQGDFDGAASEFREALKSEDKDVQKKALFNMGNAFLKKGEVEKAISAYMSALAIDPNYLPAKKNIEYILQKKESPKDKSDNNKKQNDNDKKNDGSQNPHNKNDDKNGSTPQQVIMNQEQLKNLLEIMKQSPVRRQKGKGAGVRIREKTW